MNPPRTTIEQFMRLALAQGRQALPECLPNPPVGCVLVQGDRVVSQGFTRRPGHHHAEAMALIRFPAGSQGVTAFVTLEPCAFHGRTASCAQALVTAGVEKVYVGMLDPDPRNSGAGIRILQEAGIEVVVGLLAPEAREDLGRFLMTPDQAPSGEAPLQRSVVSTLWS